jgi:hypothetical protein
MNRWTRLRWRLRLLGVIDWLLGTHLVDEATSRWQQQLETMQAEINSLQTRLEELGASRSAILRHLCLSYLQLRQVRSPLDWLHFDPQDPAEESATEVLTRALVTPHWARWTITQVTSEDDAGYAYDLVPDWSALHQDALNHAASVPPSLLDWLGQQAAQELKRDEPRS